MKVKKGQPWTKEEVNILIKYSGIYTAKELGEILDRSESAVKNKRNGLNLGTPPPHCWTKAQVNFLTQNYEKLTIKELTRALDKSERAIVNKRHALRKANKLNKNTTNPDKVKNNIHTDEDIPVLSELINGLKDQVLLEIQSIREEIKSISVDSIDRDTDKDIMDLFKVTRKDINNDYGLKSYQVVGLVSLGKIKELKVGGRYFYNREEVEKILQV